MRRVHASCVVSMHPTCSRTLGLSVAGPNVRVAVTTAELVYEPWVDTRRGRNLVRGRLSITRGALGTSSAGAPLLRQNV